MKTINTEKTAFYLVLTAMLMLVMALCADAQPLKVERSDGIYTVSSTVYNGVITHIATSSGIVCYSKSGINKSEFIKLVVSDGVLPMCPPNCTQFNACILLQQGNKKFVRGTLQQIMQSFPSIIEINIRSLCPLDCSNNYQQL